MDNQLTRKACARSDRELELAEENSSTESLTRYDFLDIGSFRGGSMDFAKDRLGGGRGLGMDINPANVQRMRRIGYDCIHADVTKTNLPSGSVRFVIASHVLEHMELHAVHKTVQRAAEIATDFVFIQGPYFDADAFLGRHGLKFYWSDWHGHTCHLTTSILQAVFHGLKIDKYLIMGRRTVNDSSDSSIHPLDSPPDQHDYIPGTHPSKPAIRFNPPFYREMVCIVRLRDIPNWKDIANARAGCERIGGTLPM